MSLTPPPLSRYGQGDAYMSLWQIFKDSGFDPDVETPRMIHRYTGNVLSRTALEVIAHRGAGTLGSGAAAPENTLCAVGYAAEWAHGMECDVQMSSDGTPVVIHDTTVDRTTDGTGTVASKTLAQLQALDAGTKFDPRFANARIPKFSDWLIAASQASRLIYPEIKAYRTTADIAVMMAVITGLDLTDRCIVQSFNGLTDFPYVRAVSTRITVGYTISDSTLWATQLAAAITDGNAVMIADYSMLIANPTFITNARAGKVDIVAWTVDSTDTVRQLVDLGVRRIMSNRLLRSFTAV